MRFHLCCFILSNTDNHSTERNQNSSLLLRLPAELRNKIYCYTFATTSMRRDDESNVEYIAVNDGLPLRMTCHKTRAETSKIRTALVLPVATHDIWLLLKPIKIPSQVTVHSIVISPDVCWVWSNEEWYCERLAKLRATFPALERVGIREGQDMLGIRDLNNWDIEWPRMARQIFNNAYLAIDFQFM